jgi:membrane dipeptidase
MPAASPLAPSTAGQFDFGLNAAEEARAVRLHRGSIVFDMLSMYGGSNIFAHYPTELQADLRERVASAGSRAEKIAEAIYWPFEMAKAGRSGLLREWLLQGGLTCGSYGIEDLAHDRCDPLSCDWDAKIRRYAQLPWLRYVTTAEEVREAKRDGVVCLYANCQPLHPVPRELQAFDNAYRKGLRSFMLTYNRMDNIGTGCTERVDAGLSMFGVDVVKHCNELGIIVDVSHCGNLTTLDACRHSTSPVTANHTIARKLYDHARGKSDEAIRAIADTGGVIGVVAVPHFLSADPTPTIEHMLDHIDYIAGLVGWQHVALGTDWPWPVPDDVRAATLGLDYDRSVGFRVQDRIDRTKRLIGFQDCRDLPNITRGLVKRGYADERIQGILGENALRVFKEVCG